MQSKASDFGAFKQASRAEEDCYKYTIAVSISVSIDFSL